MPRLYALLFCALLPALAQAEIYQWKDEKGRTHFGEEVPEKYRKTAELKTLGPGNVMKASEAAVHPRGDQRSEESPPETPADSENEGDAAAPPADASFPPPAAE